MQQRRSTRRNRRNRRTLIEPLEARAFLSGVQLTPIGTYETGVFDDSGAEIVAHDPTTQRAFFTNAAADEVGILDISNPANPTLFGTIDISTIDIDGTPVPTGGVNSVAVENGIVAVALENADPLKDGYVGFYDTSGAFQGSVVVGTLPDMLTFTPDGNRVLVANEGEPSDAGRAPAMATGEGGFQVQAVFTVGQEVNGYFPPGILDGLGAMEHPTDSSKVRVYANHELLNFRGYEYEVQDGADGTIELVGARISYFDIDKETREVTDAGLAYDLIYDVDGHVATDTSFLANDFAGFSRFCSAMLVESHQFGDGRGLEDTIYFAGEEDGGFFNPIGGAEWALDVSTGSIWHVPDMGRGAWENITEIDTGTTTHVAFILADDSSPFDFDDDEESEAVPLYLYVGEKNPDGDFLGRNGLRDGTMYAWVSDTDETSPLEFRGSGTLSGTWVPIDNSRSVGDASEDGSTGHGPFGYPTQSNLVSQAEALGAFGFSRPEDVATNPEDGTEIVLASTGVDTYAVDEATGDGADSFGTIYTVRTDFSDIGSPTADLTIIYDGDSDPARGLRSPDNLEWADNGLIYIQEDEAEEDTLTGEILFGPGAVNEEDAGIIELDPSEGTVRRVASVDRSVVLDPTTAGTPFDLDEGASGEWETSGIIDVSSLFDEAPGTLFLFDVQAHGIEDQSSQSTDHFGPNEDSRLHDFDLAEGGQLAFLQHHSIMTQDPLGSVSIIDVSAGLEEATVTTASFTQFDGMEAELREQGVRLFPGKSVSQDVEPEYIAVSPDGLTAVVTLQEANSVGILDLTTGEFTEIVPLGVKDHSLIGNGLDPSDRDDGINIAGHPVLGMYMPDAIASVDVAGETYYITANEGDDRGDADDDPWGDAVRVKDLEDAVSFNRGDGLFLFGDPSIADDDQLGRLVVSTLDGDSDNDGELEELYSYGTRSFSIWNSAGEQVYDSGDQFERITATMFPENFNANNDANGAESRSDNKGPEPEAVTTGSINGTLYAFVGLERIGGVMVYNITDPTHPEFVHYLNNRDFSEDPETGNPGDLGVEDLKFVTAEDSPNGVPLLITSNEVSGTVSIFEVRESTAEIYDTSDDSEFFTLTGNWQGSEGGFSDQHLYTSSRRAGEPDKFARWEVPVEAGQYRVSATWTPPAGNANAGNRTANYLVQDGETVLADIHVNQRTLPGHRSDCGGLFHDLGVFQVTGDTLVVELSNSGTAFTVADAIRIEPVHLPGITLREPGGTQVSEDGLDDSYSLVLDTVPTADVVVTISPDGQLDIGAGPGVAVQLTFTPENALTPQTLTVRADDDDLAEGDHLGLIMHTVSSEDPEYDELSILDVQVDITDDDGGVILDNKGAHFELVGNWQGKPGGHDGDHVYGKSTRDEVATRTAGWSAAVAPGRYRVSVSWTAPAGNVTAANRAAEYTVMDDTTVLGTTVINQQTAADDLIDSGTNFEDLGIFDISSDRLFIELSNFGTGFTVADAVRFELLDDPE